MSDRPGYVESEPVSPDAAGMPRLESDGEQRGRAGEEPTDERLRIVAVALLVLAAVLILLLLRGCDGLDLGLGQGNRRIEAVPDRDPLPGVISVWIAQGTHVGGLLGEAGVEYTEISDLGEGRFVVVIPQGSEESAINALVGRPGVHDAGLVYEDGADAPDALEAVPAGEATIAP